MFGVLSHSKTRGESRSRSSGEKDTQVVPQNARSMVEALRAAGTRAELLSFPDEGHLINGLENRKIFWDKVLGRLKDAFR